MASADLPDELTPEELELQLIYREYRELKAEEERKKNAEKAALNKNRGTDIVAEDASEVAKKLKNSGILEKLRADDAPKTQYKRALNLERRLHAKPEPSSPVLSSLRADESPRGSVSPRETSPHFQPSSPYGRPNFGQQRFPYPARMDSKDSPYQQQQQQPARPKNMFAAFMGATKMPGATTSGALSPANPVQGQGHLHPAPSYSHNADDRRTSPPRAPSYGYMANGNRQKMVLLEAENVEENFIRPVFEKFGSLIRITSVPERKQAFVLFKLWDHSQNAIRELNGKSIDGILFNVTTGDSKNEPKNRTDQKQWAFESKSTVVPPSKPIQETRHLVEYEEGEL